MRVRGLGQVEQRREVGLAGCRGEEVVGPDHLVDVLRGVVDDHGEVVGGGAVVAAQHDVVHDALDVTVQDVVHRPGGHGGAQPQGGRPRRRPGLPLRVGQVAAGSRVGARRQVRRGGRLLDLATGAEAGVDEVGVRERLDGRVVRREALGLADHRSVPVEPECGEVVELSLFRARTDAVEVLHAQDEVPPGRAREQPGEQRRAEVTDVQVAGRRGSEASGGHLRSMSDGSRRSGRPS